MASILLDRPWLLDPADEVTPGLPVLLDGTGARSFGHEVAGQVRTYANDTRRVVRQAATEAGVEMTLNVTPAEYEQIRAWADGRTLLYRDGLGNRFFGACFGAPYEPTDDGRRRIVEVRLLEVTHLEGV